MPHLNLLVRSLWLWLLDKLITVSAVYICSSDNVQADEASRKNHSDPKEWKLHLKVFLEFEQIAWPPDS